MRRILTLVAAVAVVGYVAYWFFVAQGVREGAERWVADARERGETVTYTDMDVGGFPLTVDLTLDAPRYAGMQSGAVWDWRGDGIEASARLGAMRHVDLTFEGTHSLSITPAGAPEAIEVHWPGPATGSLVAGANGRIVEGAFSSTDVTVDGLPEGRLEAGRLRLAASQPEPGEGDGPPTLLVDVTLDDISLPESAEPLLGRAIEQITIAADMTHPPAWGDERFDPAAWRAAGGKLMVRDVRVVWGGVEGAVSGELALDDRLQPAGELSLALSNYREAIAATVEAGQIAADDAATLQGVLDIFATTREDGVRTVSAPVVVRNGGVYLGPLRVAQLPPIDWSAID